MADQVVSTEEIMILKRKILKKDLIRTPRSKNKRNRINCRNKWIKNIEQRFYKLRVVSNLILLNFKIYWKATVKKAMYFLNK